MEERMFVAIARFPEVPTERADEFEAWFAWSNSELRPIEGLTGRRLLRAPDGTYAAVVEHASQETFAAMHATEVATQVHARLTAILNDEPRSTAYEVVADLEAAEGCCGGKGGLKDDARHHDQAAGDLGQAAGDLLAVGAAGGCCHDS
jgi:heme-degrading monooxygenase HmoA